jgi:hypothetical protein
MKKERVKKSAGSGTALEKSVQGVEGRPGEEKVRGFFEGSIETMVVGV